MMAASQKGWSRAHLIQLLWRERWWWVAFIGLLTCSRIPTIDGWDDAFYMGQLTSIVADGDLRLQDDVVLVPKLLEEKHRILTTRSESGALANTFSIGPAVLMGPFAGPAISVSAPPPWLPFRGAAAIAAMVMLAVTGLCSTWVVRRFGVPGDVAALASCLAILGGPLAIYGTRAYLNAHLESALLVALTVQQGMAWLDSRRLPSAIGFGLSAGLACVNRWQDVVVVAPFILAVMVQSCHDPRRRLAGLGLAGGCALVAVSLQSLAWMAQFGTPLLIPQGGEYMRWSHPQVAALLFSTYHGLVAWTPTFALGLGALLVLSLRPSAVPHAAAALRALAGGTALAVYVSACPEDWWGGASFSARRLTCLTVVAAVGLGIVLQRLSTRLRIMVSVPLALWAVLAASAHISRFEDLAVLFTGRPGPYQPHDIGAQSATWVSRWGPFQFAVPGFSLSDLPGPLDRAMGILIVTAVVLCLRVCWPVVKGSRAVQGTLAGVALIYVLVWCAVLARCPSNRDWNATWRSFVEKPLDRQRWSSIPREMDAARDIVVAFAAQRQGDAATVQSAIEGLRRSSLPVSESDLRRAALHPIRP